MKTFRFLATCLVVVSCVTFISCSNEDDNDSDKGFGYDYVYNPNAPQKRITKISTTPINGDFTETVNFEYTSNRISKMTVTKSDNSILVFQYEYNGDELTVKQTGKEDIVYILNSNGYLANEKRNSKNAYTYHDNGYIKTYAWRSGQDVDSYTYHSNWGLSGIGKNMSMNFENTDIPNLGNLYFFYDVNSYLEYIAINYWSGLYGKAGAILPKKMYRNHADQTGTADVRYYSYKFDEDGYVVATRILPKIHHPGKKESDALGECIQSYTYETIK